MILPGLVSCEVALPCLSLPRSMLMHASGRGMSQCKIQHGAAGPHMGAWSPRDSLAPALPLSGTCTSTWCKDQHRTWHGAAEDPGSPWARGTCYPLLHTGQGETYVLPSIVDQLWFGDVCFYSNSLIYFIPAHAVLSPVIFKGGHLLNESKIFKSPWGSSWKD